MRRSQRIQSGVALQLELVTPLAQMRERTWTVTRPHAGPGATCNGHSVSRPGSVP